MDRIRLVQRGKVVSEHALARSLDVGRSTTSDIVVADRAMPPHALWVSREGGTVVTYDLHAPSRRMRPRPLPLGGTQRLGDEHALVRVPAERAPECDGESATRRVPMFLRALALSVRVVAGGTPSCLALRGPLRVGRDPCCDIVLADPGVSGLHLVLEPGDGGVRARDLGSRNGTFEGRTRIRDAVLAPPVELCLGGARLRVEARPDDDDPAYVAGDVTMQGLLVELDRAARTPFPVLVLGESGVGKESLARRVHAESPRRARPFVAWNASSLEPTLVESQLFGHVRGAFTGAVAEHRGAFREADGGTLFLDELGELPLAVQARMLRVLETGEVRTLGDGRAHRVDVRVVAATHRDLRSAVREGRFREDLYYRLATVTLVVPPLRDRRSDLPAIARALLDRERATLGPRRLSAGALDVLMSHPFPGNVRQLRNLLLGAALRAGGEVIDRSDVERLLADERASLDEVTLRRALDACEGNVTRAARALGLPRTTVRDRVARLTRPGAVEPAA